MTEEVRTKVCGEGRRFAELDVVKAKYLVEIICVSSVIIDFID